MKLIKVIVLFLFSQGLLAQNHTAEEILKKLIIICFPVVRNPFPKW